MTNMNTATLRKIFLIMDWSNNHLEKGITLLCITFGVLSFIQLASGEGSVLFNASMIVVATYLAVRLVLIHKILDEKNPTSTSSDKIRSFLDIIFYVLFFFALFQIILDSNNTSFEEIKAYQDFLKIELKGLIGV